MTKLYKCTSCGCKKQPNEFYKRTSRSKGISSNCKLCRSKIDSQRYEKKKEEILVQKKQYREDNLEIIKERQNLHRQVNLEFYQERDRKYYNSDLERNRARKANTSSKRRANKCLAIPKWMTKEEKSKIRSMYKLSKKLSKLTNEIHHVDHIVPLISELVCGLHTISNLRIISKKENLSKGNKIIEDIVCN